VSEEKGKSQIPLTTQQQPQTPSLEEALARLDADKWIEVIKAELNTQYHHGTFKLDILPSGRKPVTYK
jgi:hypothetical protein